MRAGQGRWVPVAATVGVLLLVTGCGEPGGIRADPGPRTEQMFQAVAPDGGQPATEELAAAAEVIAGRLDTAGLDDPRAGVRDDWIFVSVAGEVDPELLVALAVPGELRFRKVLARGPGSAPPGTVPVPAPATGEPGPVADRQRAVEEKIDDTAMAAAVALLDPGTGPDEELSAAVAPFGELTAAEGAVLPAALQFYLPTVTCDQLAARPAGATTDPAELVVGCDPDGTRKYLLDTAQLTDAGVRTASAGMDGARPAWTVTVGFTDDGQQRWTALTQEVSGNLGAPFDVGRLEMNVAVDPDTGVWQFDRDAVPPFNRYAGDGPVQCDPSAAGPQATCLLGVVLDGVVITAPEVRGEISGDAQIAGDFTEDEARRLAARLAHGALPFPLEPTGWTGAGTAAPRPGR